MRFACIDAERAWSVEQKCKWLDVSRSGYYAWKRRSESSRVRRDRSLLVQVRALYQQHQRRYGSPRIFRELRAGGERVSRKRIARLMRQDGLRARQARRFVVTTDSRATQAPAPNLLVRDFKPRRVNRAWVGDVTYIPTTGGWLFLAVLLDLGSRRVVGWATSTKNDTELAVGALRRALAHRRVRRRLIHHTDQGSPYASFDYQTLLLAHGMRPSMSRRGDCYDNAVAESFFATLKNELDLAASGFPDADTATRSIGQYIDGYYNPIRRHSTLDYLSPINYEQRLAS